MRAANYSRVSSAAQATEDKTSIAEQNSEMELIALPEATRLSPDIRT